MQTVYSIRCSSDHLTAQLKISATCSSSATQLGYPYVAEAMNTSQHWGVKRHTARCTSPVSMIWQRSKPVSIAVDYENGGSTTCLVASYAFRLTSLAGWGLAYRSSVDGGWSNRR